MTEPIAFRFPDGLIPALFDEDLRGFCTATACHGDLNKAAARMRVLLALRTHARPLWAELVQRKLMGAGGAYSVRLDHPTYDPADPLTWFKPTAYEWLVSDFRLLLHSGFLFICETIEQGEGSIQKPPLRKRGRQTPPMLSTTQNNIVDFFLAWTDEPMHYRGAQMRGQIMGLTDSEKAGLAKYNADGVRVGKEAKPSPQVSRSQDGKRPRVQATQKPKLLTAKS